MSTPEGWYPDPDPASPAGLRWWSGERWTDTTRARSAPTPATATAVIAAPGTPDSPSVAARTATPQPQSGGDVWLPAQLVEQGHLPRICVRHGRPAVRMEPVKVWSRTPLWVVAFAVPFLLVAAIMQAALRVTIAVSWPFCERCEQERRRHRRSMWACLAALVLPVLLALAVHSGYPLLLLLVLLVAAVQFSELGSWRTATRADVVRDSRQVHVKAPSAAFVAALPAGPPAPAVPALAAIGQPGW